MHYYIIMLSYRKSTYVPLQRLATSFWFVNWNLSSG